MKTNEGCTQGTINLSSEVTEQQLIETCLNMASSGLQWNIVFLFHALAERWHERKFMYYWNLIKSAELTVKTKVSK